MDSGAAPVESGAAPVKYGAAPVDSGAAPVESGATPESCVVWNSSSGQGLEWCRGSSGLVGSSGPCLAPNLVGRSVHFIVTCVYVVIHLL